jgi:hypothetical protein
VTLDPPWDDVRLPDEYHRYVRQHGTCPNCHQTLNHDMHAFNHWRRCHRHVEKSSRSRVWTYWAWKAGAQMWLEVSYPLYVACKRSGMCTARSKPRVMIPHQLDLVGSRSKAA